MKVFVKDSTAKLNFPLTLECEIVKCTDEDKGEYEVNYLDNHFLAYCQYKGYKYNEGEVAYVLIPKGDFSKTKIILGIEKDGLIDSIVPVGNFVEDVKVDGVSVVTDSIANINNMATKNDISTLQRNFQAGVDAVGAACTRKGSPPASHSLEDTVAAIDAITTGGNYATLEVNADGTYVAAEDPRGIDAYDIVVVSKDVGQPHTVVFYGPDGNIIKTQANVPYHGYASCTQLDGTTYLGQYFKGQNPHPTNVVEDMFCYPQYGDYIVNPGEIEDDQETICATNGANYPIGSYKPLVITNNFNFVHRYYTPDGETYCDITHTGSQSIVLEMTKVAEGEDGSTSTQLSKGLYNFGGVSGASGDIQTPQRSAFAIVADQGTSGRRTELNEGFFTQLPPCLQNAIKTVNKNYVSCYPMTFTSNRSKVIKTSLDKIQVPSLHELKTYFCTRFAAGNTQQRLYYFTGGFLTVNSDAEAYQNFENVFDDVHAIDYSSNQLPSYTIFDTRDIQGINAYGQTNPAFHYIVNNGSCVNYNQMALHGAPIGFCL